MRARFLLALSAALALALGTGCRDAGAADCSSSDCPSGQVCDQATHLCVIAPPQVGVVIDIQQPKSDAILNAHSTVLSVVITDNGAAVNFAQYSIDNGVTWLPFDTASAGHFSSVVPLPDADGQPYSISVRATGSNGVVTSSVSPTVDNVAPLPTFPTADRARRAPRDFRVVFSEPVLPQASGGIALNPDAGPAIWSADRTVAEWPSLAPDTIYSLTLPGDAVRDFAGNPNAATGLASFRTEPTRPASGAVLSLQGSGWLLESFDALSNSDGISTVVMLAEDAQDSTKQKLIWGTFDPSSGAFHARELVPWSSAATSVEFHPRTYVAPTAEAARTEGFDVEYAAPSLERAFFFETNGGPTEALLVDGGVLLPVGPGSGEPADAGIVAWAEPSGSSATYVRPGSAPQTVPLAPKFEAIVSPDQWEWDVVASTTNLVRTLHLCDGGACSFSNSTTVAFAVDTGQPVTIAATPTRTLYVYTTGGVQYEHCDQCIHADAGCTNLVADPATGYSNLLVAAAHDNLVIGARSSAGRLELVERDLTDSCTSPWQLVGALDAGTTNFRPLMFGTRPGLLYQPAGNTTDLEIFIP
jgi:hypothetical protein